MLELGAVLLAAFGVSNASLSGWIFKVDHGDAVRRKNLTSEAVSLLFVHLKVGILLGLGGKSVGLWIEHPGLLVIAIALFTAVDNLKEVSFNVAPAASRLAAGFALGLWLRRFQGESLRLAECRGVVAQPRWTKMIFSSANHALRNEESTNFCPNLSHFHLLSQELLNSNGFIHHSGVQNGKSGKPKTINDIQWLNQQTGAIMDMTCGLGFPKGYSVYSGLFLLVHPIIVPWICPIPKLTSVLSN